ncbi:MAG TPA: ERF family protein [Candidatus Glassbacteria bacterium]|jgi:hypothetical protein|nr:ERF family protein [Candidatus Glassbacteria bacterium]
MKTNIYQKLHKAACEAGGVAKGKKVPGMHFNPLQHDEVQKVAMESLLNNGLYPICNYTNEIKENFVMVTCTMRIHDVENPESYVDINGCSAMGNLDKFGTGNGMSYAKKYAFLNALNLKTGLDNDDGYKASPFKPSNTKPTNNIPQTKVSGTAHISEKSTISGTGHLDMNVDMNQVRDAIKSINDIYALRKFKKDNPSLFDPNKNLRVYRQVTDLYDVHETKLNQQGVI